MSANTLERIVKRIVKGTAEFFKDQWFDRSRNVRTCGEVMLPDIGIGAEELHDSEPYQPVRPGHTRSALRESSVQDFSSFSYIDLGSGKGRTLFVAAEFPFRQITGVELSPCLHEQACTNIRSFKPRRRGCLNIQSLHGNAKDFVFPEGNIFLYLFNPFGLETLQQVLDNLSNSLKLKPRRAIVVLIWPRPGAAEQVGRIDGMRLSSTNKRYQIYEAAAQASA